MLRHLLARAVAILLIGSLMCSPLSAFAAGANAIAPAHAMSSDMVMDVGSAVADEMPCHKNMPDNGDTCPFMAMCIALCCQGIPMSAVLLMPPAFAVWRMLPPLPVQLDGVETPPPSRPPKFR
jgi:hypothetical protein